MNASRKLEVAGPTWHAILDETYGSTAEAYRDTLAEFVRALTARLDGELGEMLLSLPPGTLLCAHWVETFMPDCGSDDAIMARRTVHVIADPSSPCSAAGKGQRTEVYTSPWLCRGCGQRRTIAEGQACEVCLNRFRRETLAVPARPEGDRP